MRLLAVGPCFVNRPPVTVSVVGSRLLVTVGELVFHAAEDSGGTCYG